MKLWEELEKRIVKEFSDRWPALHRTNRSGGVSGDGDGRANPIRKDMPSPFPLHYDCKYKNNSSISCTKNEFDKAEKESLQWGDIKIPVIFREVDDGRVFAILKLEDFSSILKEWDENRKNE